MQKIIVSILLIFLFLVRFSFCISQNTKNDSLLAILKTAKEDTTKVNILNNLFLEYEYTDDEKAKEYLNKAFNLSQKIAYKKGLACTLTYLGFFEDDKGNYRQAIAHYQASLKISEKLADKKGIASSYNNIGAVYYSQGFYPEALKNFLASLKIREAIGDKIGIAASFNNIGIIYSDQGNYSEAIKNYMASLKIEEEIGDKKGVAASYNNIGIIYKELGNYPEALKNYFASLKIKEAIGDKAGIAASRNNIGNVYINQGNYSEALKNQLASLEIEEAIGDKAGIAFSYGNIGNVFTKQKKYKEAEYYLLKAKELSTKIGHKESLRFAYSALTEYDSSIATSPDITLRKRGDFFQSAYENHKLYVLYRDSLDNEETRKNTVQNQMTYDFEKKEAVAGAEHKKELENQHALAEEKSRKQKIILLFVLASLILVLFFAGFISRSLRITRKQKNIIVLQKQLVEKQKQEVEQQKLLVEEHQKEIIDSIKYAKRLQQAILPSDAEIKKHLPDSFILYKPKDIVAGDFYWMHYIPSHSGIAGEGLLFVAAADSTGHGVPGAMVSVVCSNALNRAVTEFNLIDTGKILDKTRELVLETFEKSGEEIKDGMDISLLKIEYPQQLSSGVKQGRSFQWSGANNALWYTRQISTVKGEAAGTMEQKEVILHEIKPDKQSIGKTDNAKPFTSHSITIPVAYPGETGYEESGISTFYLMTDGYADQFGGSKGKKYKYKQLQENLVATTDLSLSEQKEKLTRIFEDWKGNLEQIDDITIIGIRF